MDSLFIYTAKRSLLSGHTIDESYSLEIALMEDTQVERKAEKTVVRSRGGSTETILDRSDEIWTISFEPVQGEKRLRLKEFLDSTESGETFQAFIYGDEDEPLTLRRTDDGYKQTPFKRVGSADRDWYQFSSITCVES